MKNLFKDKENRNFILILLGIAIVVALLGWIKSGGDFETAAAIFFVFFIILIIGVVGFVGATFMRNYLDEKQSKIKNNYIKFFLTRATFGAIFFLIAFLIFRVF